MIAEMMASIRPRSSFRKQAVPVDSDRACPRAEEAHAVLVPEEHFRKVLTIERKRAERSERRFVLMLVHASKTLPAEGNGVKAISAALSSSTRETDLTGWYCNGSVIGVLCTEIGAGDIRSILSALHSKVSAAFHSALQPEQIKMLSISFRVFPDNMELDQDQRAVEAKVSSESPEIWSNKSPNFAVAGSSTL